MTRRRIPPTPGAGDEAAKAAAAAKAQRAPHTLSAAEVMLLPGAKVLEIGNAGHLRHLGIGLPVPNTQAAKRTASRPERPMVSDAQLTRMSGDQVRRAVTEGRVPGIGVRRRTWGQR